MRTNTNITSAATNAANYTDKSYNELVSLRNELLGQIEMLTKQSEEVSVMITTRKDQIIADYILHFNQQKEAYRLMKEAERIIVEMGIDLASISTETNETEVENNVEGITECAYNSANAATKLPALIVYPGGKERELKTIIHNLPSYNRFYEPFVGGGSVFMGINAKEHYINDFSSSLMNLYQNIAASNKQFHHYLREMEMSRDKAEMFTDKHWTELAEIYEQFRTETISKTEMRTISSNWCAEHRTDILNIIGEFSSQPCTLVDELNDYLSASWGKFIRLKRKNTTDEGWIRKHISAAVCGAVYKNFVRLLNNREVEKHNPPLHAAVMVYVRKFCRSGMFKYDKDGNFNTAFGGIGYLDKRLKSNINLYTSEKLAAHFKNAHIYNHDFEEFLDKVNPQENDFIFLDPPYDETFSEYDGNEFNRKDHRRLANYLLTRCKAKWMMIIKKTDFIYDLYNQPGIYIQEYGKTYTCNAKHNNKRNTIHLLITNYEVNAQTLAADVVPHCEIEHKPIVLEQPKQQMKKTRKRIKWDGIQQCTVEGTPIRRWNSIGEASKTLNLNHASISKCVNGHYKTAEGFIWVGIPLDSDEAPMAAAA